MRKTHRAHSDEFKKKVVDASNAGMKHREVAKRFKIHSSLVTRWKKELSTNHQPALTPYPFPNPTPNPNTETSENGVEAEISVLRESIKELKIENSVLKRLVREFAVGFELV